MENFKKVNEEIKVTKKILLEKLANGSIVLGGKLLEGEIKGYIDIDGNIKDCLSESEVRKSFVSFLMEDQKEFQFLVEQKIENDTILTVFEFRENKLGTIDVYLKPFVKQCEENNVEKSDNKTIKNDVIKRSKERFQEALIHNLTMESTNNFSARYQGYDIDSILKSNGKLEEIKTNKELIMILLKFLKGSFKYNKRIRLLGRRYSYSECCHAESEESIIVTLRLDENGDVLEKVEEI